MSINFDAITLDDCITLYTSRDGYVVLSNGQVEVIIKKDGVLYKN